MRNLCMLLCTKFYFLITVSFDMYSTHSSNKGPCNMTAVSTLNLHTLKHQLPPYLCLEMLSQLTLLYNF